MPGFIVDTDEIRTGATQLATKAGEMRAAVTTIETQMAKARAMKSPKVQSHVQQWDALKSKLSQMFQEAESTSSAIKTLASNIDTVLG